MNCKNCGSPLTAEDKFCKNCGTSVNQGDVQTNQDHGVVDTTLGSNVTNQSVANNTMSQQSQQPNRASKKSNVGLIVGIIALVVIVALVAVFVVFKSLNKNGSTNGNINLSGSNNGTGTVTPTTSTSSYKVNFDGFTFNIPDNMIYKEADNELLISDEDETWVTELATLDGSYSQLKNNKSQLQSYFQQNGFTANPAEVKNLGGTEFVVIELSQNGESFVGAYAKLNSMKAVWIVAYNQDNTSDLNILSEIAPVISTATYNDTSNSITAKSNIKFNKEELSKFAQ